MLFNSIDFAIFLPIVFLLYWFVFQKSLKLQNLLLVVVSYIFYGWWDWRFLFLILFSTIVDFSVGIALGKEQKPVNRKCLLWTSVIVNLGLLGFFKYFNFFIENFNAAFTIFGSDISIRSLSIILPVGISFYTFQTLSYTIDVYKKKLKPTNDIVAFTAFVSFFPQLVAGPIERAKSLLPQFFTARRFEYNKAVDGIRQILWGLFKKVVIADNCAVIVNEIFSNSADLNGSTLFIGVVLFTFQIYGDFSGYSDIAIGTARLFGFNLMQNFAFPFFSRSIPEIWSRWHISLTTWFRDYLYMPLVRMFPINNFTKVFNIFVLFTIIGFWHGASWNFVLWGVFLAVIFIPSLFKSKKSRKRKRKLTSVVAQGKVFPSFFEILSMAKSFLIFVMAMVFFRTQNFDQIVFFFKEIFSLSLFDKPIFINPKSVIITFILIIVFMIVEWFGREQQYGIEKFAFTWKKPLRYAAYYVIIFAILWYSGKEQEFIYFQF